MEDFKMPVPVEWCNKRVLTTAQIAEFYGCETRNISDNFKRNEERFVAGKHYFKLEGADLKQFKSNLYAESGEVDSQSGLVGLRAPVLYLWTERGAARHAKMLSTDKAWEVFELLEDNYFNPPSAIVAPTAAKREPNPNRRAGQLKAACVYVLLLSDNSVKIGHSSKIRRRVAKIKRQTGLTVNDLYFSSYMSREIARLIEWACQEKFSSRCIKGEFFSVSFEEACAAVDAFAKAVDTLANIEPKKILVLASKDNVKLIAGRN